MLINFIYLLSFLTTIIYSTFYFRKNTEINLKYISVYLFFMFLSELLASFIAYLGYDNLWVYNSLTFIEFNCLFFFFRGIILSKRINEIVLYIVFVFNVIYLITNIYYLWLGSYLATYNSIASISGSFFISIVIFLFFRDFLYSDKILSYWRTLSFWMAFGLLVYYIGTIPITSVLNSMIGLPKKIVSYLFNIQILLTIFMYCCFITGALWSQKRVK